MYLDMPQTNSISSRVTDLRGWVVHMGGMGEWAVWDTEEASNLGEEEASNLGEPTTLAILARQGG